MSPTAAQRILAANAAHATDEGKLVVVYISGHKIQLTDCSVDPSDEDDAVMLVGMNHFADEVLIDVAQMIAIETSTPKDAESTG
tara:strand:+ start:224 stop:475 length:252 start_codon:yes stop_codon:yes gene_type:complete